MWFNQQLNSFLNLGICKEYPNMARAKSTSGGKSNPTNPTNKEPNSVNHPVSTPDTNAFAGGPVSSDSKPQNKVMPELKPELKPEPRKFELRKTEPRKNVVPINIDDEIRRRAYELYLQREPGSGSESEDWLTAEREVMQRYHQHSA
jgi:hypothetical protein